MYSFVTPTNRISIYSQLHFGGGVEHFIVCLLLEHGVNIKRWGGFFGGCLEAAAASGDLDTIRVLLKKGADVNGVSDAKGGDGFRKSPLGRAILRANPEAVRILLNAGATLEVGCPLDNLCMELKQMVKDFEAKLEELRSGGSESAWVKDSLERAVGVLRLVDCWIKDSSFD